MSRSCRIAYLDCFSGISGDMLLGAMIDAGLDPERLRRGLEDLGIAGWRLTCERVRQSELAAVQVRVATGEKHAHRGLADLSALFAASRLDEGTRRTVMALFKRLAEAEGRVHGVLATEIHFHETGALDAIIDLTGAVLGLKELGVGRLVCSPLPMSRGWTHAAHGLLPLPAPAVCQLLHGVPVYGVDIDQELVTPTGAVLAAGLAESFGPMPPMRVAAVGYGAGHRLRPDGRPNLLRLVLGQEERVDEAQRVMVIETQLDDWSPETFPYLTERLLQAGALDVGAMPLTMKKGRPGLLLRVVAPPELDFEIKSLVFSETSAIGLRFHIEERMTLPRRQAVVQTPWGPAEAKRVETPTGPVLYPEYESCRALAAAAGLPLAAIYREVARARPGDELLPEAEK